jgi:hypothetical protein
MRRLGLSLFVAASLGLVACGSSRPVTSPSTTPAPPSPTTAARATTTVPTTVAPTTVAPTTTAPDPDVVPAVITPAYVDAVFVVLDHIYGNAVRSEVRGRSLTKPASVDLRSISIIHFMDRSFR